MRSHRVRRNRFGRPFFVPTEAVERPSGYRYEQLLSDVDINRGQFIEVNEQSNGITDVVPRFGDRGGNVPQALPLFNRENFNCCWLRRRLCYGRGNQTWRQDSDRNENKCGEHEQNRTPATGQPELARPRS